MIPFEGTPFLLHEATLTFYLADSTGDKLTSANPVWTGALAHQIAIREWFNTVNLSSTGAARHRVQHLGENHAIEIEKVFLVRKETGTAFRLRRNQRHVLEIVWAERDSGLKPQFWRWYRRIYYGVTIGELRRRSLGPLHFLENQLFDAERFVEDGGQGAVGSGQPSAGGDQQIVQFTKEQPLLQGEFLSGAYRWSKVAHGINATVHAHGPSSTAVILTLVVNGELTGFELEIVPGGDNVDDEVDLGDLEVPANAVLQWQVTQAPISEESAYHCSVEMALNVET